MRTVKALGYDFNGLFHLFFYNNLSMTDTEIIQGMWVSPQMLIPIIVSAIVHKRYHNIVLPKDRELWYLPSLYILML